MQNSSPPRAPHSSHSSPARRVHRRRLLAIACIGCFLAAIHPASTQTLARPGWAGSGLNADPWWQHAIFYDFTTPADAAQADAPDASLADYKAITAQLGALRALGVDALLVDMPDLAIQAQPQEFQTQAATTDADALTVRPSGPAIEDFDELVHQASRVGMRVLITFPASVVTPDLANRARFWLTRGVAGFHLVTAPGTPAQEIQAIAQALRKVTSAAVGQRIVLADFKPGASTAASSARPAASTAGSTSSSTGAQPVVRRTLRPGEAGGAQLQIDSRISRINLPSAANLRPLLAQSFAPTYGQGSFVLHLHPPVAVPGAPDPYPALADITAAILLATHPAALIDSSKNLAVMPSGTPLTETPAPGAATTSQKLPPTQLPAALALTDWYRQLSVLHHGNAALRSGSVTVFDYDDQNALVWVARPTTLSAVNAPVVVACNLSASPVQLSIGGALLSINLHGSYLHTLLRSDNAMGPQELNAVILPPYSVYVGELRR